MTYILVVLEIILAPLLPSTLASWPVPYLLLPPVAFIRGAMLVWDPPELVTGDLGPLGVTACLLGSGTALFGFGVALHSVERWRGIPDMAASLLCLGPALREPRYPEEGELLQSILSAAEHTGEVEDVDVVAERERLAQVLPCP